MSFEDVVWARVYQGIGIALLVVPITSVAYVGIPQDKSNDASALINLSRNIGGSFGISIAQTWLIRRSQFHQTRLVSHLTPFSPRYQSALDHLQQVLLNTSADVAHASRQAAGIIYAMTARQAEMLAYIDVFYLMAIGSLLLVPLVLLLRKTKGERPIGE